jgi:hypothetical protein
MAGFDGEIMVKEPALGSLGTVIVAAFASGWHYMCYDATYCLFAGEFHWKLSMKCGTIAGL